MHGRGFPLLLATLLAGSAIDATPAQTKLLRFPDLHGDQVVFCYAGDLWKVSAAGGTAVRLTSHVGQELFPKFSPDGQWIAFTGQIDGDEQVYVMPAAGGTPRQLTYYPANGPLPARWGYDHMVYGWTPDGTGVFFRSLREAWSLADGRLYVVDVAGGLPRPLPPVVAGAGDFSPDGQRLVYSPLWRDFRTWKRYQGGWAQELFVFDLSDYSATNITNDPFTDRDPMWIGDRIYFCSDRDGTLNLYAYDVPSRRTEQVTQSTKWDVRWPSKAEDARIVFELGGELQILDTATRATRTLAITVPDEGLAVRPRHANAGGMIEDYGLSPKGERAVFAARGDVFSAPIEHGPTRNLTRTSNAHDKAPAWSPDGRQIAFLSDRSGEEELYLVAQDGRSEPEALTSGGRAMRYAPEWSPTGTHIAFSDKDGKLTVLDPSTREAVEIADEERGQLRDFAWSPDGRYIAYSLTDPSGFRSIHVWSRADGTSRRVTDEYTNDRSPRWDPDGKYLFFLGDREFAPRIGALEWNYQADRITGIFALALRKDVPPLFPARSDEVTIEEPAKPEKAADPAEKPETKEEAEPGKDAKEIAIDFEGLAQRVERVPVEFGNLGGLSAVKGHLFYFESGGFYYGRSSDRPTDLHLFDLKERKDHTYASGVSGYALSQDGKKVLVRQGRGYHLGNASPGGEKGWKTVSTADLTLTVDPRQEWLQIFDEVWRRYRDFFYVENMHGYDWDALRRQYRPLVQHVAHRSDLNYVIGEMIAELNVGHAYITGGDFEVPTRPSVALPGARFELDAASGRYRLAEILEGDPDDPPYRAPLREVGVDARPGDYVLEIDGQDLRATDNPYRLLRHAGRHPVTLLLNQQPNAEGARTIRFRAIDAETKLYYWRWVAGNRRRVSEATDGRVGYLHVPNMGADGIREFIKWYYPQVRKEGLVIDDRGNGGGNVSQMLIERLRRVLLGAGFGRTTGPDTYPDVVFHGHLVCLLNENSASDGDIFPAMFRQAGLGPLIGKRSWGGIIGITDRGTLIDGGTVNVPEFGNTGLGGAWTVEGYGVDPDIVVENDPKALIEGRDPQLERAIEVVLERMRNDPKTLPVKPPDPVRRK